VKPRRRILFWTGILVMQAFCACRSAKSILLTEQEELALAQAYVKDRKWDKARSRFQRLIDRYPGSVLASEAMLGKAESYFLRGEFAEAQTEYQLFLEFYPAHERADLAQFRIGLCQADNMRRADRDQSPTLEAIKTFEKFLVTYPKSQYTEEASARLAEAKRRMRRHDEYVARFYGRRRIHLAAALRYRKILDSYALTNGERDQIQARFEEWMSKFVARRLELAAGDFEAGRWFSVAESVRLIKHYRRDLELDEKTRFAFAEALFQLNRQQEARSEFEAFLQEFPQSQYAAAAQGRITELETKAMPKTGIEGGIDP
jgi:outer membrane protein assembly factor BamD